MTNPPQKDDQQGRTRGRAADRGLAVPFAFLLALLAACRADPTPPSAQAPGPTAPGPTAPGPAAPGSTAPGTTASAAPQTPPASPPAPAACDAPCQRDDDCAVATPPSCGDCVAVTRSHRGDHACTAAGCRANICDEGAYRARCDASRRCVLAR